MPVSNAGPIFPTIIFYSISYSLGSVVLSLCGDGTVIIIIRSRRCPELLHDRETDGFVGIPVQLEGASLVFQRRQLKVLPFA